jgi:hypothetical protein
MALTFLYFPAALVFGTAALVVFRAAVLPRWMGWLSAVAAALDVVAGLTIFGGTGNTGPLGLLPIIVGATPVVVWFVAVSIVLLGSARGGQKAVSTQVG